MSHFVCVVLCPAGTTIETAPAVVEKLIAAYYENIEVPEYEEDCYCVGRAAKDAGWAAAEERLGSFAALREAYWAKPETIERTARLRAIPEENETESEAIAAESDRAWKAHIAEWNAVEKETTAKHPFAGKPDAGCDECHGSGKRLTTYNPKSKWDFWSVGGRWAGWLGKGITGNYDPEKDPNNIEVCWVCKGTGRRTDELGQEARRLNPDYTCNGCSGTGKMTKWPTQWEPSEQDVVPTHLLEGQDKTPFAIVTPDGAWHEKGEMGWFALVSNEMEGKEWKTVAAMIYALNPDTVAVAVDCHI